MWAYAETEEVPQIRDLELRKITQSRIPFWRLGDRHVHERDTFYPPVRLLRHGMRSIYSRSKGGVDGSTQARVYLGLPTSSFKFEQKIVSHTSKTFSVNALISWRMLQMKGKLGTKESFQDLDHFRDFSILFSSLPILC
jgi:hypothetical protein